MVSYAKHFTALFTPQREKARSDQVKNNAGGFVFELGLWPKLDRWLILGCEGGSYYATERAMTLDNAKTVLACLTQDGLRTVARIVEVSRDGRAPKNAPAVFALAMASADTKVEVRRAALSALPDVCRTGTDLFHFVRDVEGFRRWGRGLRKAVAAWYNDKPIQKLAYQAIKYRSRDGWSHRDVLRLAHPTAPTPEHQALYRWITGGREGLVKEPTKGAPVELDKLPAMVTAFEALQASKDKKTTLALIREHRFTHEMLLTEWKNDPEIWEALLEDMPLTALLRNLGKMTAVGLFGSFSSTTRKVARQITDAPRLKRSRVHPVALLSALKVYEQGHGERAMRRDNALSWKPAREIVDALNDAFYLSFKTIDPTGKRHLLALDVSGSMCGGTIAGVPGLSPRVGSAAMALATAKVEPFYDVVGFTGSLTRLGISAHQRLDDVLKRVDGLPFGSTDCALPMIWAKENKVEVDTFVVYTDNETWFGKVHPFQALRDYRQATGRAAKLVVVGMTATGFTIADPSDAGMLDVVGFDAAAPALMADFARA